MSGASCSNTISLRDYFLKHFSPNMPQGGNPSTQGPRTRRTASLGEVSMCTEFCYLLREIWSADSSAGAISPDAFFTTLCKAVPIFRGYQQQDSQEFLRFLLDRMHTELSTKNSNESTVIWRLFRGILWNKVGSGKQMERVGWLSISSLMGFVGFGTLERKVAIRRERYNVLQSGGNHGKHMLSDTPSLAVVAICVTCLECGNVSDKEDPFLGMYTVARLVDVPLRCFRFILLLYECSSANAFFPSYHGVDLSLDIPEKFVQRKNKVEQLVHPCTVYDCLEMFTEVEELADTERYECERCKAKQRCTKKFTIKKLPDILCLHLKRFRWSRMSRSKIDTYVAFPIEGLDMSKYSVDDKRNNIYDLFAAVVHHGSGPGSGHYTSYAWNPTASQWFNLNDAKVTTSNGDAIAQEIVYMLFYKRRRIRATARQVELLSLTTPVSTPSSSVASSPVSSPESPSVSVSGLTPPLSGEGGEGGEGDEGDTSEPREIERAKRGRNDITATTPNHTDEDEEAAEGSSGSGIGERSMESVRGIVKRGRGRGRGRGRPRTKL
ncbi:hypothetical protein BC937DRAFT_86321 [Endogone sp. FLAS-F59071]|nr:hypothetical protein BC937DRAFT_86321 [Endogone sp. FLAS-F59071]|eukprot:RUS20118.1 hypothetical protein BC937DRAFT_86321 [Endogone sp. FLAS-F59071]